MATNKNITMRQYNGVDYDTLYPKTIAAQIDDVYSKDEMSNLFLPKAGGSMGGILDMNGNKITNLPTPTSNSEPATKEYVDSAQQFDVIEAFNGDIPKNKKQVSLNLNNLTKTDLMKASFMVFKFSNIAQVIRISLPHYSGNYKNLEIYHSPITTGVGTSCITLNFNKTEVEDSNRISRLWEDGENGGIKLVLQYDNNKFLTTLFFEPELTANVTLKIYIYVPKA